MDDIKIKGTDSVPFKITPMKLSDAVNPMNSYKEVIKDATVPSRIHTLENLTNCPRCGKPLIKSMAIDESESDSFKECPSCGTLINTFRPTTYQAEFLRRTERYKMTAGGFGTGKSRVDLEDVIKHVLLIQGARVGVFGRSYPALQSTFIKEFYGMFPARLVRSKNESKHEIILTNGSEIIFRSFDDPNKIKSMNLTMIVIIEASDCPLAGFTMSQSRIRNTAAMIPYYDSNGEVVKYFDERSGEYRIKYRIDARHISLETNPDSGWVKHDFLLEAAVVEFYGEATNEGYHFKDNKDPFKYIQVVSTMANPHLPPTYEEEQTRGKSKAYIMQFYKGSFNFSSNLVFPNFGTIIKKPHRLPREFNEYGRRVLFYCIGVDYGINDPTHAVFAAYSSEERKLYAIGEYRKNDTDVKNLSKGYRLAFKENGVASDGLLFLPGFDGKSYNKRESDLTTIGGMFEAEGLFFEPVFASHEARIIRTNALINHEQMEVFSTCEFLIEEALNYKFILDKDGNPTKKPKDGKDHGVTALEFIIVRLPHNLHELRLSSYLPTGTEIKHDIRITVEQKEKIYNPLEVNDVRNDVGFINNLSISGNTGGTRVYGISSPRGMDEEEDDEGFTRTLGAYIPRS